MNLFNRLRATFGRHQKAEPRPAVTGGPSVWETHIGHSTPRPQRDEYKATWTELTQTFEQAKQFAVNIQDEERIRATAEKTREVLEATVGVKPEDHILEIGCGFGRVGAELAPRCARWIGCDVSPRMVAYARERLSGFDNVEVIEISGFDLQPVPDESIDVVYCTVVFMHLDEWDRYKYVLEARRVLRPGGRVYIDNFSLCSDMGWTVFEEHREIPPHERPPHISKSSTPQELETYLKRAGFRDIELKEDDTWLRAYAIK
ncbi:MAG: class I SAM-dependent methyltransferase [Pyrinomonadaceae bacterium]